MLVVMRPKLLQPTRERPHERRARRRRAAASASLPNSHVAVRVPARAYDPVVARVREAGGPVDNASYSCGCGYVFCASVSTTVTCPHCGVGQAW